MCNLKSNKTLKEVLEYKKRLANLKFGSVEFVLFPSTIYLPFFYDVPYKIGSQNVSRYAHGSYTGEVLASQLSSLKVSYVLINHAEANDKTEDVIKKIKNATIQKMKVVLCVGEENKQSAEETKQELITKIDAIFLQLTKKEQENILIAYEPSWAIHNGDIVLPEVISIISTRLKDYLKNHYHLSLPILYGGSINTINIKNLTKIESIDGYLVGNCANIPQNIAELLEII